MTDLIGRSLGRYRILERLGEGGMATVYKAYDTRLERDVAIKIIRKDVFPPAQLDRILTRFEREAKALAKLSHPNIVNVLDYGEYEGSPYLAMVFLPCGTLKQSLGKPIPWMESARILLPIARALQYAHGQGIIHRDIKPSNILITLSGEPVLSDFGIAKILESEETATLTGTGIGVGTPEYMAPEQWIGKATHQSDVYSLGVVFYEMVTGRKPYIADTPAAILLKQNNEPLPRPIRYAPDLPANAEKVLLKALALKPENRYLEMAAFASALENLLSGQSAKKGRIGAGKKEEPAAKPSSGAFRAEVPGIRDDGITRDMSPGRESAVPVQVTTKKEIRGINKNYLRWGAGFLAAAVLIPILLLSASGLAGLGKTDSGSAAGAAASASASARMHVTVATDATWPLFEEVDASTGKIIGFDIDLMNAIAEKAGLDVEIINVAWESLLTDLSKCRYDAAISVISITEDRKASMLFSDPYYTFGQQILVGVDDTGIRGTSDLKGKRVGAQISSAGAAEVGKIDGAEFVAFDAVGPAVQALIRGDVDAVITDNVTALGYANKYTDRVKTVGDLLMPDPIGIAVCKSKADLRDRINAGLAAVVDEGIIGILSDKWIKTQVLQ